MRMVDSMAMGASSAQRNRRRWTTGWRDGRPRLDASAAVAGRMTRVSTRELGTRPSRSISWVKVMSRFARRWAGGSATKLPRPGSRAIRPSSASRCMAFRAVIRLTPNSIAQLRVRRQPFARVQPRDPLAQGVLDLAVLGLVAGLGHRRADRPSAVAVAVAALGAVDRRADRPGPRPEFGRHDLDLVERGGPDASPQLVADRPQQQVAGRRDPAADDDPVRRDDRRSCWRSRSRDSGRPRPGRRGPARRPPEPGRRPLRPSPSRRRPRSGRPGRTPPGSRWFPHPHGGPSGSIVWWPISPAVPSWPWWTRPSIAITPPTPSRGSGRSSSRRPRPAPRRSSARPNARASLISETGAAQAASRPGRRPGGRPSRPAG